MSDYEDEYDGYGDEEDYDRAYSDEEGADYGDEVKEFDEGYEFYEDEDRVVSGYRLQEQQGMAQESYREEQLGTAIDTGRLGKLQQYRAKIQAGEMEVFTGETERLLRTALPNVRLTPRNKNDFFTHLRKMKQLRYRNPSTVLLGYIHHLNVIPDDVLQGYLQRMAKGVTYDRVVAYKRYWDNVLGL